jgi:curved DNA-binding protein CbpA
VKDYYAVLGISWEAHAREIKRAYKKSVKKWHPDLHPDDPAGRMKMQEINEAYEVLSDPDKRRAYDQQRENGKLIFPGKKGFYAAHGNHPFLSYFLKMNAMSRKRDRK